MTYKRKWPLIKHTTYKMEAEDLEGSQGHSSLVEASRHAERLGFATPCPDYLSASLPLGKLPTIGRFASHESSLRQGNLQRAR
jgi:hypothetical protein